MEEKLRSYLNSQNLGSVSEIQQLTDGNSNNHLNYKIVTSDGVYVARVTKPGDMLSYSNLADEHVILKLIEKYDVGPKSIKIDLENFETPLLVEEFIDGVPYSSLTEATEEMFEKTIDLLVKTSSIPISVDEFPFKFSYTTFQTNFRIWDLRIKEIENFLGEDHFLVSGFKKVVESVQKILKEKDLVLRKAPKEFIYNDVHPGNIFWIAKENKVKFIDWQKVSTGNPAFMISLFARRFGKLWKMDQGEFSKKVLEAYLVKKNVDNLEDIFCASMLERAVSDMIWWVWADLKKNIPPKVKSLEEDKYYQETMLLMSRM